MKLQQESFDQEEQLTARGLSSEITMEPFRTTSRSGEKYNSNENSKDNVGTSLSLNDITTPEPNSLEFSKSDEHVSKKNVIRSQQEELCQEDQHAARGFISKITMESFHDPFNSGEGDKFNPCRFDHF